MEEVDIHLSESLTVTTGAPMEVIVPATAITTDIPLTIETGTATDRRSDVLVRVSVVVSTVPGRRPVPIEADPLAGDKTKINVYLSASSRHISRMVRASA